MPERCTQWCIGIGGEVIGKPKCKPCVVIQVLAMCCHRAHPSPLLLWGGEGENGWMRSSVGRANVLCPRWEAYYKRKEAGHYSGLSMRTKRSKIAFIGCGAADLRLTSHTEHCAFASQRRNKFTRCPVPCQSPVLVTCEIPKNKGKTAKKVSAAGIWPRLRSGCGLAAFHKCAGCRCARFRS